MTIAFPSPQFEAQRLLLLGSSRRLRRNAGCLEYPIHRQSLNLGFGVNWDNYTLLTEKTTVAIPWNPTYSSIILLDTLTSDLSRHLKSLMSHTQKRNFCSYHCIQCTSKHLVTVLSSSMLHKTYASKHKLQLFSRLALPPWPDPFPELLTWGVGCANRNFAHWRRIVDTCDSPEPSSSKKKRTMVPSAWPDRIPFPDTLQRNTDRMMQYCRKTCTFIFISHIPAHRSQS